MGTVGWLLVVAIGIALGFSVGKLWPGSAAKLTELQRERDAAREDLQAYRQDVSGHFERTAELFDKVTADYRGLYEHLATGARRLGAIKGESLQAPPLAEPERRRLAEPVPAPAPVSVPATAEGEEPPAGIATHSPESEAKPADAGKQPEPEDADLHPPRDYPPAANDEPEPPEAPEALAEDEEKPARSR